MLRAILRRNALLKGLLGGSQAWTVVGAVIVLRRLLKRLSGDVEEVVYRGRLEPGHALAISHLPEDRRGRVPRRLRKRPDLRV